MHRAEKICFLWGIPHNSSSSINQLCSMLISLSQRITMEQHAIYCYLPPWVTCVSVCYDSCTSAVWKSSTQWIVISVVWQADADQGGWWSTFTATPARSTSTWRFPIPSITWGSCLCQVYSQRSAIKFWAIKFKSLLQFLWTPKVYIAKPLGTDYRT